MGLVSFIGGVGSPRSFSGKEFACSAGDMGLDPWVGKMPWRRRWLPTPAFLPAESRGQRSLAGYSPGGLQRVACDLAAKEQVSHE